MRSLLVRSLDGPGSVSLEQVPDATAGEDEVLVEVRALGLGWTDLLQTRGQYQHRPTLPFQLGTDVAGVVRSAPSGSGLRPGGRVLAMASSGGGADVVAVAADAVFPLPAGLGFEQAAAIPMNYFTAHYTLVDRGQVTPGSTVLVTGAAGGVGTASLQVARALGARTIAVVSTEEKAEFARRAGAHHAVLADGFLDAARRITDGAGVDIVVDVVGEPLITDALRSLAPRGRLMVVGFTGRRIPEVRVNRLLLRDIDVRGVGWNRSAATPERWARLVEMIEAGQIDPPLGGIYEPERVAEALVEMEERRSLGKPIVRF